MLKLIIRNITFLAMLLIALPVMLLGAEGAGPIAWLQESWQIIVGVILVMFGAFWIPGLRTIMVLGLKTLLSEKVLKSIFLVLAQKLVDSTETTIDNTWLDELKKKL